MLPYDMLDDSEKEYDRATAYETLALICKLGYKIVKPDEQFAKTGVFYLTKLSMCDIIIYHIVKEVA